MRTSPSFSAVCKRCSLEVSPPREREKARNGAEIVSLIQAMHLHFVIELKFQCSHCVCSLPKQKYLLLSSKHFTNLIGSPAYAVASG